MERVLINIDGSVWGDFICTAFAINQVNFVLRKFPDGETYFRVSDDVNGKEIIIVCTLNEPNTKAIELILISKTLRENGAKRIGLVAPYLSYMRQDTAFNYGESISAKYFAALLSDNFNWLITVDPHLHRIKNLEEIFSISTRVLHAAPYVAKWIKEHVQKPLIMGPDSESKQWVARVAKIIEAPYIVIDKIRLGDTSVKESEPDTKAYPDYTPVILDDIISTAQTMIEAVKKLKQLNMAAPLCIGIHAVFAHEAYKNLLDSGAGDIITCNTIVHPTNKIDVRAGLTKLL